MVVAYSSEGVQEVLHPRMVVEHLGHSVQLSAISLRHLVAEQAAMSTRETARKLRTCFRACRRLHESDAQVGTWFSTLICRIH